MEAAPSRHRSRSRHPADHYEEIVERPRLRPVSRGVSRRRAVSVHDSGPRASAPVQYIGSREPESAHASSMVLVRPRESDHEIHHLEEEIRRLRLERQGGIEITRQRDTEIVDDRGNEEEITEIRRQDRKGKQLQLPIVLFADSDDLRTEFSAHACYDGNSDLSCLPFRFHAFIEAMAHDVMILI